MKLGKEEELSALPMKIMWTWRGRKRWVVMGSVGADVVGEVVEGRVGTRGRDGILFI